MKNIMYLGRSWRIFSKPTNIILEIIKNLMTQLFVINLDKMENKLMIKKNYFYSDARKNEK